MAALRPVPQDHVVLNGERQKAAVRRESGGAALLGWDLLTDLARGGGVHGEFVAVLADGDYQRAVGGKDQAVAGLVGNLPDGSVGVGSEIPDFDCRGGRVGGDQQAAIGRNGDVIARRGGAAERTLRLSCPDVPQTHAGLAGHGQILAIGREGQRTFVGVRAAGLVERARFQLG